MSVVVIQTVHEQTIGEGRIAGREAAFVPDHRALAGSGGRGDTGERRSGPVLCMRGECQPQGIECMQASFLLDLGRQRLP